ncbi:potassium-transporting ATPase subunit C [Streptomyces sp. NPDC017868]|uniref:potassium-transporting ATPase subunit C n=1 Tax=Streptomyces sp. NPDC017868 TaxID=3365014 RepID=UPI00378EDB92
MNNNIGNAGRLLWAGLHALLVLTVLCGVLYPLAVTGIAQAAFPGKANGSEIKAAKAAVVKDNSVPGRPVRPSDVPADAVTSSGSGLDPHISPRYARLQVHRVAARNHLTVARVDRLVADHIDGRILGFIGEPRVNVLRLDIALRELMKG